jgi:hypothetical protein
LTVGQKRRRIERLQKCVARLEEFDPVKARKRAPAVLELEAAIDKALSSAFGYGTPAYLRYNEAATLDPNPLLATTTARANAQSAAGPVQHDAKVQETREQFSGNKSRAIALLQQDNPWARRGNQRRGDDSRTEDLERRAVGTLLPGSRSAHHSGSAEFNCAGAGATWPR